MRRSLKNKKTLALTLVTLFILNLIDVGNIVKAEDNNVNISLKPQYNADIVLTVEDSNVDPSNFEKDLRSKLQELGVKDSRIKITGLRAEEVSAEDTFAWKIYDHKGNWGEMNYPNGDGKANPKDNQHIIVKDSGKNITFYGYGQPGYKDFMFMENNSMSKKTFDFEINESGINYHSMEGGGFLFNSKIENGLLSGYCILFTEYGINLYKVININAENFHNEDYELMSQYPGVTLVKNYSKDSSSNHTIKIEVTEDTISMWDNENKTIDSEKLDSKFGNSFGPIASYASHNCNILSYFSFNNLSMQTTNTVRFKDLIRQPKWDLNSKRFVVNLNDTSDEDFHNESTYSEIQSRIISENIHYIGWGTDQNKSEANDLVSKNNENGLYVDNLDYNQSINKIASYIYDNLKQQSSGETKVLIGQPMDIDVTPESLKQNTADEQYPYGGWKLNHDETYYENDTGKATFDGQYMDNLDMIFEKTGKYDITFKDSIVSPNEVYAHRRPIANFDANVVKSDEVYNIEINESSYDEDAKSQEDKGIKEKIWKWREAAASTWNSGLIPQDLEVDKQYLVELQVKDYDDVLSIPLVKYISTKDDDTEKPLANFILTPSMFYKPLMKNITMIDNSYDPQGKEITDRLCTVEKDGKVVYSGATPMIDFSDKEEGEYTVSLKVKTTIWSEGFSRTFTVKDVQDQVNEANGDVSIIYAQGDNEDNVTQNLTLSTTGMNNTLVRWKSNDVSITQTGKVSRPGFLTGDKVVTLTATLYNNGVTSTKKFDVKVKALPNNIPTVQDSEKIGYINQSIQFEDNDFISNYNDIEKSNEVSIKVISLPSNGKLVNDGVDVKESDVILISDISKITFVPSKDFVGTSTLVYQGFDGDDYSQDAKMTINIKDNIPPVVTTLSIESSNSNKNYAKEGDTIKIKFTTNKILSEAPKVNILGNEIIATSTSEKSYEIVYSVKGEDLQGVVTFDISKLKDNYGNESENISNTTDNSYVIVDTIAPVIDGAVEGRSYKPGVIITSNEGTLTLNDSPFVSGNKIDKDGIYTVNAVDTAGNYSKLSFEVDGVPPIISNVKDNTNYNVSVKPTLNEGAALLNGKEFVSGTEVSKEGTYNLVVTDRAGNVSIVTFAIDKTPPMIQGVIEGGQYNKDVNPTFDEGTATLDGKPYNSGTSVTTEGTHTILVTDKAGNKSEVTFIIDKTVPIITGAEDGKYYNNDRRVEFNEGVALLDGKEFTSGTIIKDEGEHLITVVDASGNQKSIKFVIDKTTPEIYGVENEVSYKDKVVITFNEGEALLNANKFNNGSEVTEEGTYTIVVTDKAGNSITKTFVIDKTKPVVTKIKDGETYKEDMIPEFNEGTATLNGKPYTPGNKIDKDGEYILVVTDNAGNETVVKFTIDKSMPLTLNINGKVYSAKGAEENAKLILVDVDGRIVDTTTSSKDGGYSFKNEKVGLYKVVANKDGAEQSVDVNLQPSKPTDKEKVVDIYLSKYKVIITADPNSIVGDGEDKTTLKVTVLDENNNPVPEKSVTLEVSNGSLLNGDTVITDKNGNALFTLQSSKVTGDDMITVTVSAKVNGLDVPVQNNAVLHFAPGSIKGVIVDNNTGLPISDAVVEVSKDFDNNGIPEFYAKVTTKEDGKYKIAIPKGNVAYDVKITKPIKIGNQTKMVTFHQKTNAGSVTSEGKENYNASNTVTGLLLLQNPNGDISSIDDYSNYKIMIVDENGNSVSGIIEEGDLNDKVNRGIFNFSGLEKNKVYYANVYYNLSNGLKIKVGSSKIRVNNDGELNIATCLIDPYGDIIDKETGKLIAGAQVKLYYANTERNKANGRKPDTLVELPTVNDFPPANNLNPQISDANGKYAWMVFPYTDYYIVATADGYEKYVSDNISVEEEIVRHDIQMEPIKVSENNNIDTITNDSRGNDNSENSKYDTLVNTGSQFDSKALIVLGAIMIVCGICIYRRKEMIK
ncbi:immunoglobulin-like domain-containing protein [Clostridium sp. 1001275B_160808_H3]|uniref:immunoglobulin-like domain-containing protein n=1 Tax=Clostridium sp. 1001275B_160808_H3 TaxID=2787110 RepID=UPI001898E059|nr:immunoglobulin-like domain-containing protein [Clostridium sp. 1001275B_160808_H3]